MADEKTHRSVVKLTYAEAKAARELRWEASLESCLQVLKKKPSDVAGDPKTSAWKIGIAAHMKPRLMTSNAWLAEHLHMGVPSAVSRYASEAMFGKRSSALTAPSHSDTYSGNSP